MTDLSYKQEIYKNYLLKKVGFIDDDFLSKYISFLELVSPKFKYLGKQNKVWSEKKQWYIPENESPYTKYIEKEHYFLPEKFNIIDFLSSEIDLKMNGKYTQKNSSLNYISATDIANFTYCPVSFAISKTFELPKLESAILGTSQHEKHTLINYLRPFKVTEFVFTNTDDLPEEIEVEKTLSFTRFITDDNKSFFEELTQSSIIFYGHDNNESKNKFFKSITGNFVGQPDYIFKNGLNNDIFVVEEKFQFIPKDPSTYTNNYHTDEEEQKIIKKKRENTQFFSNHINQLSSYIYGISEYEIKYGYLVYWKYEIENDIPKIVSCSVRKIEKTPKGRQQIRETFIALKTLVINKGGNFDINSRVPAKCASCVSNLLCGHKTGRFFRFSIPYSNDYIKIYFASLPEELKKQVDSGDTIDTLLNPTNDSPL